ncbi:7TM receptor with intracellular metal dependent phosphohydrolase [Desulfofarcimen acetoxidans DSM 771]|uniref:7TM receptor with intracellular metal dependent phosphohydrolase n=1 Tax=Desulfofarcimen acetoxidans (strain ATCC 49208 / DSM 771 / KCTC 5769 / VKM B-1644 / 5575) TaxID=485916 RepID=C8W3N5_DESAS|nr:HDIG domain-containing metalloprotein [Desulfofarcimen acetoxidans]ACV63821.1 7TM receptor with intracellular metal dependent phosphohydrolase [Desulfofarcimen acetoxidans DSM 771]
MLPLRKFRSKLAGWLSFLMKQRKVRRSLAAILFLVALTFIISVDVFPHRLNMQVGQVSPLTIKASRSITFEDRIKTEEARRRAVESVPNQYMRDPQIITAVQRDISSLLAALKIILANGSLNEEEKIKRIKNTLPFVLSDENLAVLAQSEPESLTRLESGLNSLVSDVMEEPEQVTQDNLETVKTKLSSDVDNLKLSKPYQVLAREIINKYMRPNAFVNTEETQRLKRAAIESVSPIIIGVKEGEKIIGEGEIVTDQHMAKLEALGYSRQSVPYTVVLGTAFLVGLMFTVVMFYLYQQNREIYKNPGHLYLIGIIVVVVLAVSKGIISINITQWPELGALLGYMAPLASAGMLIAILLDSRLAVLVVAVMSLFLAIMTGGQIRFGLVGMLGGITGVYSVSKLSQRGDLVRSGMYTSLANILAIFTVGLMSETPFGLVVSSSLILGLINGILCSVLTNGALPYLESTFGITSAVRLLELSNPNNVLLKKLLTEAPGTYHHSILVGNLAESAADAVGGDSLMVRVGAYYHDIGKIKRPCFFIENQLGGENPHEKIAPSLSTLILTSHVKDGVELARENKLPKGIVDIIEQHHGTTLITYFYNKALENDKTESVNEEDYRYESKKPQTKEAAIVMLSDSVEAAVRALQNRTPGKIEGLVRKIIKDKLMDGQLDECDLTLKDLDIIANAFSRVLSGIFHTRIEYPDMSKEMERRKAKRDSVPKQLTGKV